MYVLISAIDNQEATLTLVKKVLKKYPNIKLMVRAKNRYAAYDLINHGVNSIYRESIDTSIRLASDVLLHIGHDEKIVESQANMFFKFDEESLHRLAGNLGDQEDYIFKAREVIAEQERILREDRLRTQTP